MGRNKIALKLHSSVPRPDPSTTPGRLLADMQFGSKDKERAVRMTDGKRSSKESLKALAKAAGKDAKSRLRDLSPAQRDLLLQRLLQNKSKEAAAPSLVRVPREAEGSVPLSFAQERLWFADRLAPGDPALNISGALRLKGRLVVDALEKSFDELLLRHETLRATFSESADGPVQFVHPPRSVPIVRHDLRSLDPAQRETELTRLYAGENQTGFDLERDLLLRVVLIQLADQEHLLVVSMHHMSSDGWSIGLVLRELGAFYSAHVEGRSAELPELPIRYSDFAAWQRATESQGAMESGLAYWREKLADPPPVLELPGDLEVPDGPLSERTLDGATIVRSLGPERKRGLEELSRRYDTTLFTTLLCAFMALLARLTAREDILVGTPVSNRQRVETEGIVSLFLNTLALRAHLPGDLCFYDAIADVRRTVLDGLEHMDIPFERVVQELVPERSASRHPLFGTFFNFTPKPIRTLDLPNLRATYEAPPTSGAQFSLELYVTERGDGLDLELLYHRSRYSTGLMEVFIEQFDSVLAQVVADPGLRIAELDLVTPISRALLSDPTVTIPRVPVPSVVECIAQQIAVRPQDTALEYGAWSASYSEFGRRMVGIAQALAAQGFEPGQVVAVSGPRSPGVVMAMAGVLLAGGVLLTLSTDLPEQRRTTMVREAGARWLLHVGEAPELGPLQRISVGLLGEVADEAQVCELRLWLEEHPAPPADVTLPAYVFFTSGSTGTPKGVLGNHGGLAHFLAWQRETFGVGPGHRCAQFVGISFDVVLRDIFLPLSSGATLVLPEGVDALSGGQVLPWLHEARITHLHVVPSVLQTWLQDPAEDFCVASIVCIFCAGEALTASLVQGLRRVLPPSAAIVNLYGPTETTLAKCAYEVPEHPRSGVQPLGRPMRQAQALVLRPDMRQCGIGEPGEIALRTPYRSLGYINAPEEQARRFVQNPGTEDADDLLYLTGDRGVIMANGMLEFRGRLDHQVKIAGIRVEPTEVSAALQACDAVSACAVVAQEAVAGTVALVAYVVSVEGYPAHAGRLREYLRPRLPGAMVPSTFEFMDQLPLDANHKLDRSRLPVPSGARPELKSQYIAPRDGMELQLVRVWEELLDVRPIGVTDNFFDLGGHSLMALRLLVNVKQLLGQSLPLPALFERPTVEHLAAVARSQAHSERRLVPLWNAPHRLALFLVHPGGGMLWNYSPLVRHLAAPVPIHGLAARGIDGVEPPHDDLETMAADYVAEIRAFQPEGPYLLAGHSLGGAVAYEMARQLTEAGEEVPLLAILDTVSPALRAAEDGEVKDDDTRRLMDMVAAIEAFAGNPTGLRYEALRPLGAEAQIKQVVEALQATDALPPGENISLIANLMQVGKAHVCARRAYRAPRSAVPITLFRATKTDIQEDTLGWAASCSGPIQTHWVPGDHITMMSEPHVQSLARELAREIERAVAGGS